MNKYTMSKNTDFNHSKRESILFSDYRQTHDERCKMSVYQLRYMHIQLLKIIRSYRFTMYKLINIYVKFVFETESKDKKTTNKQENKTEQNNIWIKQLFFYFQKFVKVLGGFNGDKMMSKCTYLRLSFPTNVGCLYVLLVFIGNIMCTDRRHYAKCYVT